MKYEQITVDDRGSVRVVTLNRPEKLNAWTPTMQRELYDAFTVGNEDSSVGAFVVTGAGRGFCAGADVSEVFARQVDGDRPDEAARRSGDWVALGGRFKCADGDPIAEPLCPVCPDRPQARLRREPESSRSDSSEDDGSCVCELLSTGKITWY